MLRYIKSNLRKLLISIVAPDYHSIKQENARLRDDIHTLIEENVGTLKHIQVHSFHRLRILKENSLYIGGIDKESSNDSNGIFSQLKK